MNGRLENKIKMEHTIDTLLTGCPQYLTEYYYSIMSSKEPRTCYLAIYTVKKFLSSLNEDTNKIDIKLINDIMITRYLHNLETIKVTKLNKETGKKESKVKISSASYINTTHCHLKDFFNYMLYKNYIDSNPMENVKRLKRQDVVKRPKLDENDLKKILYSVENGAGSKRAMRRQEKLKERDFAIMLLLMNTGMRETALTEINMDDIDFQNNKLTIVDKRQIEHTYFIGEKLRDALLEWIYVRKSICTEDEYDALFISSFGSRITAKSVQNIVKKYSKDALGYEVSPHKLRAAYCTILYDKKKDIEFVREAVGHSNVAVTQRYIVKDDSQKKEASNIMNSLL